MTAVLITDQFFPDRRFQAPMDAAALKNYPILERVGFFPIERETTTGLKNFLRDCRSILSKSDTVLWLTPTGRFADVRESASFMGGLSHLVETTTQVTLLSVAVEYPFWNERFPELLIEFGPFIASVELPASKQERTAWLENRLKQVQLSLAEKSIARSPNAFETMAIGVSGVGGLYDFFRRFTAIFRGKRYQLRHEVAADVLPKETRSLDS